MNRGDNGQSTLFLGGHLPPTDEYETVIQNFPGNNAHAPWGERGRFRIEAIVFERGREVARVASEECDESGNLRVDVGAAASGAGKPAKGMFVVEYRHARDIPVEVYAFHIHKATGTYVACNITPFIGDQLYPTVHSDQLENTLFWPGIVADGDNDPYGVVVNPYDQAMGFQFHLIGKEGVVARSEPLRLKGKTSEEYPLCRLFGRHEREIRSRNGAYSYCVSSQYKLITYFMLRNNVHGVMTMMDHLHNFCLA